MAFPLNGLLDDFNRADSANLGANWTSPLRPTDFNLAIASNAASDSAGSADDYWNVALVGPDCEVYSTVAVVPTVTASIWSLWARIQSPGVSKIRGYKLAWTWNTGAANDTLIIQGVDNNALTQIGSTFTFSTDMGVGDKFGLECIGSTISAYTFQSGAWTQRITTTDTTYNGLGYLALSGTGGGGTLDDFSGGNLTNQPIPLAQPYLIYLRRNV